MEKNILLLMQVKAVFRSFFHSSFLKKSLKKEEVNYGATELECAAIVWAIEHFHKYFGTNHFTLVTDHSALQWLNLLNLKDD